jgi:geranylgeranyl diphosphate synthase type I
MTRESLAAGPAFPEVLLRWSAPLEEEMRRQALPPTTQLGHMAAYHLGWVDTDRRPAGGGGGKRMRSSLCLWAAAACGAKPERALPVASAIELLHNFTLVHDDIQDGDLLRRGRPTVWSVWGQAQAINAGDVLFALALRAALAQPEAARVLVDATVEVIEGQCLDLHHEGRLDGSLQAYVGLVEAKTGALLGASLEAGAVVAGAASEARGKLRRAGRLLGIAFQLRDDWLGVWGDPELTGKSRDGDIERRKLGYPVVAAHAAADEDRRRQLERLYASRPEGPERGGAVAHIRRLLEELGGAAATAAAPMKWATEAIAAIESCAFHGERVQEFVDVAHHVAERSS